MKIHYKNSLFPYSKGMEPVDIIDIIVETVLVLLIITATLESVTQSVRISIDVRIKNQLTIYHTWCWI